ncbi:MAG TPA: universal stress protein [Pedomonas sp.]|uniref:universal stress protein n=1 Tax=Pedomonas sp. TaxID=2976421 RepID=UPI002F3E7760
MTVSDPHWIQGQPQTLLLATDLTARCDRAHGRAIHLARRWNAELILLHVLEGKAATSRKVDEEAIREQMSAEMPCEEIRSRFVIARGAAAETILEKAGEFQADLIITGVARYNALGDFILGTTVDRVVRQAPVPVLVVKRRPHAMYEAIAVGIDFSPCSRYALEAAATLFPANTLDVVHAYHVPFEGFIGKGEAGQESRQGVQKDLDAFLAETRLRPDQRRNLNLILDYGQVTEVVVRHARERELSLVVLGTRGRAGLSYALLGSAAEALLSALPCDVLLVRPPG